MNLIPIILPLLLIALLGFVAAKKTWLSQEQFSGLSKITFSIFIPAFLFYRMAQADLSNKLSLDLFASFYLPVLLCFGVGFVFNYFLHSEYKKHFAGSAVFALGSSYSNNVIVGLPVLLLAIGDDALPIIFVIVTFHSAMLFALTSAIAAIDEKQSAGFNWFGFIKQTLSNPLVAAILSGLVVNLADIEIPYTVGRSLDLLGQPAITLALLALGASIARYDIRGERQFIALASLIKLVLLPGLVWLFATKIFMLSTLETSVLVVLSACPTGVNAYLIAQMHKAHRKAVASTVVVSTIASIISLPLWLIVMNLA
ncbi:AEC family transporter [Thalassotalea euphylliae]|uniref:AEC family transporter n=1 Tax=Thalassotalea euphylliae TaxID=1655234 RepID=UPI0036453EFF